MHLEGTVLVGPEFEPVEGRVIVADDEIVRIEETSVDSDDVILPAFVNAHTHIGDSIAKEAGEGLSLDELVAPPDGLKHRLLREASHEAKVAAMARSLRYMESTGTGTFLEFREGGVKGVAALRDAVAGEGVDFGERAIDPVVFGRDDPDVLSVADGYGASGARDADFDAVRSETRARRASCSGSTPASATPTTSTPRWISTPTFSSTWSTPSRSTSSGSPTAGRPWPSAPVESRDERRRAADPRPRRADDGRARHRQRHARLAVDVPRDGVRREALRSPGREILRMATVNGAAIAGLNRGVIELGADADLLVLDGDSDNLAGAHDLVRAIVRRAGAADVSRVVIGGEPAGRETV